jgi:hypothetical protein
MSVILDALKKAEADRQRDGVPEIRGAQSTARLANARRRRLWFIALLGTLVCTGAAWFTLVGVRKAANDLPLAEQRGLPNGNGAAVSDQTPTGGETAQTSSNGQTTTGQNGSGTMDASFANAASSAQTYAEGTSTMNSDAFLPAPAPELLQANTAAAKRVAEDSFAAIPAVAIPTLAQPNTGAAQPVYVSAQNPQNLVADQREIASNQALTSMAAAEPTLATVDINLAQTQQTGSAPPAPELVLQAAQQTVSAAASVPELYQLDYPTRHALPKLGLTVHVYDANSARSFVIVNNKRFGEGEQIEGSVLVAKIHREGVECEFNGQRFMLPRQL